MEIGQLKVEDWNGKGLVEIAGLNIEKGVIPLLDGSVVPAFMVANQILAEKNIKVTYTELFRQPKKYSHFEEIWKGFLQGNPLDKQDVAAHGIKYVGTLKPHLGGLSFDVGELGDYKNYSYAQLPPEAKAIVDAFQSSGFKWEGGKDPVHFTAELEMTGFSSINEANAYKAKVFESNFLQKYGDYECQFGYHKY